MSGVAAFAQEPEGEERERGHAKHGGERVNEIAVVVGGTYVEEEAETFFTVGVEYERLFPNRLGVAGVAEYVPDIEALVLIAPMTYRPVGPLRLVTGPGVAIEPRSRDEERFLWRFGVGYSSRLPRVLPSRPPSTWMSCGSRTNGSRCTSSTSRSASLSRSRGHRTFARGPDIVRSSL
jgi:hypothetical protein